MKELNSHIDKTSWKIAKPNSFVAEVSWERYKTS